MIVEGYKLEFIKSPPQSGIRETSVPRKNLDILNAEVAELFRKDATETVPFTERNLGFYNTFFLVPKKNGKARPVINLGLNRYLKKEHFKMDTLTKVLNLLKPPGEAKRLGNFSRFERCIHAHTCVSKAEGISLFFALPASAINGNVFASVPRQHQEHLQR